MHSSCGVDGACGVDGGVFCSATGEKGEKRGEKRAPAHEGDELLCSSGVEGGVTCTDPGGQQRPEVVALAGEAAGDLAGDLAGDVAAVLQLA